jgi:hypothetical protein
MLFGRGQWAVFGVKPQSVKKFEAALKDPMELLKLSQLAASVRTKFHNIASYGINPFGSPRLDEGLTDKTVLKNLDAWLAEDESPSASSQRLQWAEKALEFVPTLSSLSLDGNAYGFWLVLNTYEDMDDPASKKEAIAYKEFDRPFKFLNKEEKKAVEQTVAAQTALSREQFPVLVDFDAGRVYAASSNVDNVTVVQEILAEFGAETIGLAWDFGNYDWPELLLNKINKQTKFSSEMSERAEELRKFRPEEVDKLDDKMMERVVSTFFAITELETGLWAGLTTPARIKLHPQGDPVTVGGVSTAFSLLEITKDAEVAASSVIFQNLEVKTSKKGVERQVRSDLFTLDVNENINLVDAGAAMLRGFDLPGYKKECKANIKEHGQMSIQQYWRGWLMGLHMAVSQFTDIANELLHTNKEKCGLRPFSGDAESVTVEAAE